MQTTPDTAATEQQARLARRAKQANDRIAKRTIAAPQPFVHQPIAPYVPPEDHYKTQRSFSRGNDNRAVDLASNRKPTDWGTTSTCSEASVFRWADTDAAELTLRVGCARNNSETTVVCTAAELREIAARLLDAAHDLDTNPSSKLMPRAA